MTTISSKTILRSRNRDRVASTLLLRYPRCIHSEFMTHRVFSRNAASSRAIPVSKLIKDVIDDPFVPLHWGKHQKGMQAGDEIDTKVSLEVGYTSGGVFHGYSQLALRREIAWLRARDNAVQAAWAFHQAGYHKQIINRLLEPFAHITVVVTATDWANFLLLRDHPDAEPHIQILAREIKKCLDNDPIQDLKPGQWHLPFVDEDDWVEVCGEHAAMLKLSVARCASTSYKTVDGFDMTLDRAVELHDRLVASSPLHASPAEHQLKADHRDDAGWHYPELHGNTHGFIQYRKTLPGEFLAG